MFIQVSCKLILSGGIVVSALVCRSLGQWFNSLALHASVVHASGYGQLQANPHVAGPWLSPGKPTRRAVTPAVSRKYPLVEKTSGDNLEEKSGVEPLKAV